MGKSPAGGSEALFNPPAGCKGGSTSNAATGPAREQPITRRRTDARAADGQQAESGRIRFLLVAPDSAKVARWTPPR